MQAIILAAGMGRRLGEFTQNNTKCMLEVNGRRLIDRMLDCLCSVHVSRTILVIGYKGENVRKHIGDNYHGMKVEYVVNSCFDKTNNIYSLYLAKEYLCQEDTILLESDLIFDYSILRKLIGNPSPNIAVVAKYESWMEGTMVRIDDDENIVSFISKEEFQFLERNICYKTVNIYKFSREFSEKKYIPFLEAYCKTAGNNEYYENVLRILSFLNSHDLKAMPLSNEKWYEIDDKQDLDIAETVFAEEEHLLPKYYGRYGGFWRFPQMLDYCYLVNPFFPPERMIDELESNFRTLLTEYPSGMKINTLLASKCWGVKEDYVVPGNGAAELIKSLSELLTGKLGIVRPTFEEYPNRLPADRLDAFIPGDPDFRYGVDDLIDFFGEHRVESLLLINPDNPSGNFISKEDVCKLAEWCEKIHIQLILDESFVDFSEIGRNASMIKDEMLELYPHMVVLKSISKSYGVPGLRLGILASADKELVVRLKKKVSIWNINSFAEFFMQVLSKYEKEYAKACSKFVEERKQFISDLKRVPFLRIMPTQANFVFCEVFPPYTASGVVIRMLKEHDILMSNCSAKKGLCGDKYLRIAVRGREDNERLVAALLSLNLC